MTLSPEILSPAISTHEEDNTGASDALAKIIAMTEEPSLDADNLMADTPDTQALISPTVDPAEEVSETLQKEEQASSLPISIQEQNKGAILTEKVRGVGQSSPFFARFNGELNNNGEKSNEIAQEDVPAPSPETQGDNIPHNEDPSLKEISVATPKSTEPSPALQEALERKKLAVGRLMSAIDYNRQNVWKKEGRDSNTTWAALAVASLTNLRYNIDLTTPAEVMRVSTPLESWKDSANLSEGASGLLYDLLSA